MNLRSLLRKKQHPFHQLEQDLGYTFRAHDLLATALLHPSYRHETAGVEADNQRLEFLGDAALGLVAGEHLYQSYENLQEGALTCLRSRLTNGQALAEAGRLIGLGQYLVLGKGERMNGGEQRDSNLTDAMEAIFGAAYLDGGMVAVRKIFLKLFMPIFKIEQNDIWSDNPKGHLQVETQRRWHVNPHYQLMAQDGPPHAREFTVEVLINGKPAGRGRGSCKRDAEQQAAATALKQIQNGDNFAKKTR